jgi:hypothetical protein
MPLADSLRYVALETNENILVSNVLKVVVYHNRLYIHDSSRKIMVFSMEGKFLFEIDNLGLGPGEYSSLQDFCVSDGRINLLDLNGRKLLRYNASDGSYVSTIPLRPYFYNLFPTDKHHYLVDIDLYQPNGGMGVLLLDSAMEIQERLLQYDEYPLFGNGVNVFSALKDSAYSIFSQIEYTTYHFTLPNKLTKRYKFDFNKGVSTLKFKGKGTTDLSEDEADNLISPIYYKESEHLVLLQFLHKMKPYSILYTKQGEKSVSTYSTLKCEANSYLVFYTTDTPNLLASRVIPQQLELLKNTQEKDIPLEVKQSKLYDMALKWELDDNPIIQLIYLKTHT